jgi:hypothetical protein
VFSGQSPEYPWRGSLINIEGLYNVGQDWRSIGGEISEKTGHSFRSISRSASDTRRLTFASSRLRVS